MARKRKQDDPLAALLATAPTGTLADLLVRLATTRPDVCRECFDYLKKHATLSPSQRRQSEGERPLALWDELAPDLEALDEYGSGDYGADARVFSLLHEIEQALSRKQIEAGYRHELLDNVLPYIESGNAGLEDDLYAVAHATCYTDDDWRALAEAFETMGGDWKLDHACRIYHQLGDRNRYLELRQRILVTGANYHDLADFHWKAGERQKAMGEARRSGKWTHLCSAKWTLCVCSGLWTGSEGKAGSFGGYVYWMLGAGGLASGVGRLAMFAHGVSAALTWGPGARVEIGHA